jgi:hypothetical protein
MAKAYHDEEKKNPLCHDDRKDNDDHKDAERPKDIGNAFQSANKTITTIFRSVAASKNKLK